MTLQSLVVKLAGDTQGFVASMVHASASMQGLVDVSHAMQTQLKSVGFVLGGLGASITGFLALAVRESARMELATAKLSSALKASGVSSVETRRAFLDLAQTTANLTGETQESVIATQTMLLSYGLTTRQVQASLIPLAQLAQLQGRDLTTAARLFALGVQSGGFALRRLLPELRNARGSLQDFNVVLAAIQKRVADSGQVAQTFLVAIARLRGAMSNLLNAVGKPLLGPLTTLTNFLVSLLGFLTRFAESGVGKVVIVFVAFAGVLLTAAAAVTGLLITLGFLAPLFAPGGALAVGVGLIFSLFSNLIVAVGAAGTAFVAVTGVALGPFLAAIALLTIATVLLLRNMQKIADFFLAIGAAVDAFVKTGSFAKARDAFNDTLDAIDRGRAQVIEPTTQKAIELGKSVEDLAKDFQKSALEIDASVAQLKASISSQLVVDLSKSGLDAASVKRIVDDAQRQLTAAQRAGVAQRVAIQRGMVEELRKSESVLAEEIRKSESGTYQSILGNLDTLRKKFDEVHKARVETEKKANEEIVQINQEMAKELEDISTKIADTQHELQQQELAEEKDFLDRRLELRQKEGQLQIDILNRAVKLEADLAQRAIDAREAVTRAGLGIERQQLEQRFRQREQQIALGFADEQQVIQKNLEEETALAQKELSASITVENQRAEQVERNRKREIQAAVAAAEIKKDLIRSELEITLDKIDLEEKASVSDLEQKKLSADAEQSLIVATAKLRTEAAKKALSDQITLARAQLAALPEGAEAERLRRSIDAQEKFLTDFSDFETTIQSKRAEFNEKIDAQIALTHDIAGRKRVQAEKSAGLQIQGIDSELSEQLIGIDDKAREAQVASLNQFVDTRARILQARNTAEDKLRAQGILTEEQIQFALRPFDSLLSKADTTIKGITTGITDQMKVVDDQLKQIEQGLDKTFKPIEERVKAIADPLKQVAALFPGLTAPIGGTVNQTIHNTFTASGVTIKLSADEAALLERLFRMLMGPEGNREFDKFVKSTQGNQPAGATGGLAGAGA